VAKAGILHDYDLYANLESAAQKGTICAVCGTSPMRYQWSDYSGEGMCTVCGCPYQLKWGSDEMKKEGAYPYMNLDEKWLPIIKEYWEETRRWTYFGRGFERPGMVEFATWVTAKHPEMV
jgi:hypothetical protein